MWAQESNTGMTFQRRPDRTYYVAAGAARFREAKHTLVLCTVLLLAGCASKTTPTVTSPQPVNGQCGVVQDVCLFGTPADTGDTTPPYGWKCLGLRDGRTTTCSVPIAKIEKDEVFGGQNALEAKVKAAGPLRGMLTILDRRAPDDSHADDMWNTALDMGIPEENLHLSESRSLEGCVTGVVLDSDCTRSILEKTLVLSAPTLWATDVSNWDVSFLRQHDYLAVVAAGNTESTDGRDIWYRDHPVWKGDQWKNAFAAFSTGKFIIAKYADGGAERTPAPGEGVVPLEGNVKCGNAKDYCYSIVLSELPGGGTSSASVRLGALAFYLFQLWDTAHEVVNVLNVCAEDVGAPGIDEEFGRGVVSVVCDTVRNREVRVASSSTDVFSGASPVMVQMTAGIPSPRRPLPQSLARRPMTLGTAPATVKPFFAVNGYNLETVTGHVGGRVAVKGTDLLVAGGADYAPLGVRSSLLGVTRTPFMEFGARRALLHRRAHQVALLGVYGYSSGGGLSAHVGHLGARYDWRIGPAKLSAHAGYQQVRGMVGLPGYREAGAQPVQFTNGHPEVRVSIKLEDR